MADLLNEGRRLVEEKLGCSIPSYVRISDEVLQDALRSLDGVDAIVEVIKQDMALHESGR
jgi:hypothetical protein